MEIQLGFILKTALLNILFYLLSCAHTSIPVDSSTLKCDVVSEPFQSVEYVRNYDGDTLTVNLKDLPPVFGSTIGVRIRGIDTAEMRGKNACEITAAKRAQIKTKELLSTARTIKLVNVERDKYFRILADVFVDGRSVAIELLNEKLAIPYDGGKKTHFDWCNTKNIAH